ncbi:MAG: arabinan endo-1,5-alpha-L-arabinosidase [Bacteroidales bacterium]
MVTKISLRWILWIGMMTILCFSCRDPEPDPNGNEEPDPYDPMIADDYSSVAHISNSAYWGPYNLHDPTIIRHGEYYYIFSTDVMYGYPVERKGTMFRRSKDLVHWEFLGWAFNGIPQTALQYILDESNGGEPNGIWAPYILKVGDTFRLYYSASIFGRKISCIGLATSSSPEGPWEDQGIVIATNEQDEINAIDPTVVVDAETGQHWMAYGSYFAGIYMVELDPATGMLLSPGDSGERIAFRNQYMDAIEGPEILYHPGRQQYYLFVSYGWLEDSYNVRVGRSDSPDGPYYDIYGNDMAQLGDNLPMITAQYQFDYHSGWQGVGHNGVLRDGEDYYFVSQGRPGSNKYLMNLHLRKMFFTSSGWPVVSPERYAGVPQTTISEADLVGKWEHIDLADTEAKNESVMIEFIEGGSISGKNQSFWTYSDGVLTLSLNNGDTVYEATVLNGWDWERRTRTILYTGLASEGLAGWGKKVD